MTGPGVVAAVISQDPQLQTELGEILDGLKGKVGRSVRVQEPLSELRQESLLRLDHVGVRLVLLDLGSDPKAALDLTKVLVTQNPERPVILVGPSLDSELLLAGMRAGASEYLARPLTADVVVGAISRLSVKLAGSEPLGRTIAVAGGKGGAGVTTVATNLAVQLARRGDVRTLLLDLDELGTAGVMLGLWPRYSVSEIVENLDRVDQDLLDSMVERHESGLDLFAYGANGAGAFDLGMDQLREVVSVLKHYYDYVVVDLGRSLAGQTEAVVMDADEVLVVCTGDLPSVRNAKRLLEFVEPAFPGDLEHLRIVFNQFDPKTSLGVAEVADTLGHKIQFTITRDDLAATKAANLGRPLALNPNTRVAKDLQALTDILAAPLEHTNGRRPGGLRGRLSSWVPFGKGTVKSPAPKNR